MKNRKAKQMLPNLRDRGFFVNPSVRSKALSAKHLERVAQDVIDSRASSAILANLTAKCDQTLIESNYQKCVDAFQPSENDWLQRVPENIDPPGWQMEWV